MASKKFLTSKEAADYLGIEEEVFEKLVSKKIIPIYKIGGIYTRFKIDDLESYRRKGISYSAHEMDTIWDNIKDFFYFNDFYIISIILTIVILYLIFR